MTSPFALTNLQLFEVCADRAKFFLDRSLEVFSLETQTLDAHK
jgi:hypothetical protein